MAKKPATAVAEAPEPVAAAEPAPIVPATPPAPKMRVVVIQVAFGEPNPNRYDALSIAKMSLTSSEARALGRIREELRRCGAKLADGRPIEYATDAVRWLIQQTGKAGNGAA